MNDDVFWLDIERVICNAENPQTWDSVSVWVLGAKILENQHVLLRKISKSDFSLDLIKRIFKQISMMQHSGPLPGINPGFRDKS